MHYDAFRTGLTYGDVFGLLWSHSSDSKQWKYKRRGTVLGLWHQLKQDAWKQHVAECTGEHPFPENAPRGRACGERNGCAKLTARRVRAIRRSDAPVLSLARRYGVSCSTIRRAKRGLLWTHLETE